MHRILFLVKQCGYDCNGFVLPSHRRMSRAIPNDDAEPIHNIHSNSAFPFPIVDKSTSFHAPILIASLSKLYCIVWDIYLLTIPAITWLSRAVSFFFHFETVTKRRRPEDGTQSSGLSGRRPRGVHKRPIQMMNREFGALFILFYYFILFFGFFSVFFCFVLFIRVSSIPSNVDSICT